MANPPRKFSEKIALHNQKQAEETAAFEQIMREVGNATRGAYQKHHLHINHQALGTFRGGSLPNVNQIGNNSIDLQNALNSLEEIKQGKEGLIDRAGVYRESRSRQHVVSFRSRQFDKRVDCSPYSLTYLSPPPDTSWRRTNSDSALHQSTMNPVENYHNSVNLPECRRVPEDGLVMLDGSPSKTYWDSKKQSLTPPMHSRPKSCEVPGINIYHSEQEPGIIQFPVSKNTGSLPDLTNLQFPSPLETPLDVEDQNTPPYNTASVEVPSSPAALSPTSLSPHVSPTGIIQQTTSTTHNNVGVQTTQGTSPGPSPTSRRRLHHNLSNLVIAGSPVHQVGHPIQGLAVEAQAQGLTLDPYQQNTQYTLYQHPQPPPPQQHQHSHHQQSLSNQPSPSLGISTPSSLPSQSHISGYRSGSPGETSCSAPQSPVSQSLSPSSSPGLGSSPKTHNLSEQNYYLPSQAISANTVQQSFEQFNLIDNVSVSSSIKRVYHPSGNCLHYSQVQNVTVDGQDLLENHYYGAQSGAQMTTYSQSVQSPLSGQQQTTPQTPQTPSSIPDIILTDFSTCPGAEDAITRHDFVKDIGTAMAGMSGSFDSDLFPTDDALKAGLDPIDFDGLQMLTDPDIVTDAATEDSFRLDRL